MFAVRWTARLIVLRSRSPPSSPAPSAPRCAALELDRGIAIEPRALVPSTPRSVSCRTWDLPGPGFVDRHDELCHCLDLHVAVLELPFVVLFQQHRAD
jgi:hypothetical protein